MKTIIPVVALAFSMLLPATTALAQELEEDETWGYGFRTGSGYFSFRNSLFVEHEPDPPGDLSDDWFEVFAEAWLAYQVKLGNGLLYAHGSVAYVRTADDAAAISGGTADSLDVDDLYVSYLLGRPEQGEFEVSVGRIPYVLGKGMIIADGYADGGSRGGAWTNIRKAWAPGGRLRYARGGHLLEYVYLERDDRPESITDTVVNGINYEWLSESGKWNLGSSWLWLDANDSTPDLAGADVYNLRAYIKPFSAPMSINAEWVREDNGEALDADAWYLMADWSFEEAIWSPVVEARYMHFEGDDPNTSANEEFNPLFTGFYDWGSFFQGEVAAWFVGNSNLNSTMLRLHLSPTTSVSTGLVYYDFKLDQPGSYQGGVQSNDLATEINWYMDWSINDYFSVSLVGARNWPGAAVEEAFDRSDAFLYGMIYVIFNIE